MSGKVLLSDYFRSKRLRIIVRMTDNIKLVATGKIRTKSPLFITTSPGNLNRGILGKTRKTRPTKTNTVPNTIKNLAINCNCVNGLLFFLLV